jgi:hypothetical protein
MFEVDFKILNQKATPAIYADTTALRPAAGFAGRLFVATDSPYGVFRDTGSAWVQVASNGGGGGSSTGVNGLNGTTNIGLGGTITGLTQIFGGGFDFNNTQFNTYIIEALNINGNASMNNYGNYIRLQSGNLSSQTTNFYVETNKIYTSIKNQICGLSLDDTNGKFSIGDYSNGRKYNSFVVNDDTNEFYLTTSFNQNNTDQDLFYASNASASVRFVKLGDFNSYNNDTYLIIDDIASTLITSGINGIAGLNFDFSTEIYELGANNAVVICDNNSGQIDITSLNIILSTTPVITTATITNTATATIPSNYLSIQINGNNYKILLFNP